jgi:hypothetical protein
MKGTKTENKTKEYIPNFITFMLRAMHMPVFMVVPRIFK